MRRQDYILFFQLMPLFLWYHELLIFIRYPAGVNEWHKTTPHCCYCIN